jgi:hypothetical protein
MNATAVLQASLAAAGLVLLLRAIGRAVTLAGARVSRADRRERHYLAGRLDGVQITAVGAGDDELLVSITAHAAGPLADVFHITASTSSLARVWRWRDEGAHLRAYLSQDGAIMLADPVLGGNAACEPSTADARHAQEAYRDQSPTEDR